MKPDYAPIRRVSKISVAALAAVVIFAVALLFPVVPAGANERGSSDRDEGSPSSPLAGMDAEVGNSGPERLLVEVPEDCRLAARSDGEGASLTIEAADGARTVVAANESETKVAMTEGRLSLAKKGGNLEEAASGGNDETGAEAEVVEAEGFVCLEASEDGAESRVLSETATASETSEEEEPEEDTRAEDGTSAGQQTEPLDGTATINREGGDGDIESIEISAACETDEEAEVAEDASITLTETGGDEEEFVFTDGSGNVDITADGSTVTISPADADEEFIPAPVDGDGDEELEGRSATVEDQTDISCGAVSTTDDDDGTGTSTMENTDNPSCATGQAFTDIAAFSRDADDQGTTMRTDSFTTTGESFRVRYTATSTGTDEDDAEFRASVVGGGDDRATESFAADLSGSRASDSGVVTVADLPAGTYRFRVVAQNVQYDITVAECRTASSSTNPSNTNNSNANPSRNVIANTVPDKTLANTGGPRLGVIAAGIVFVAVGAGLVLLLAHRGRGV